MLAARTETPALAGDSFLTSSASRAEPRPRPSTQARWAGRIASGLAIAFLSFDTIMKLVQHPEAVAGTVALGFPAHLLTTVALIELVCLVLYVVPRTAVLGAVLWTGYLGGAIASHLRLENPLFSHTLFPVYVAVLLWGGLWFRDTRLRTVLATPSGARA